MCVCVCVCVFQQLFPPYVKTTNDIQIFSTIQIESITDMYRQSVNALSLSLSLSQSFVIRSVDLSKE